MGHASRLFNGSSDQTLIKRVTPTEAQREFLQTQWNALADFVKADLLERHQYPISTWLQGSYKMGTLIKPVSLDEEYDVDVGVYFEWSELEAEPTATQLRSWVQESMRRYQAQNLDVKEVVEPAKPRCSRAVYAKQFHIDTPVYHLETARDKRRLATLPNTWELRDPKPIYKWFKSAVGEGDRDQLRRLVRYFKAWAALSFDDSPASRPSSVFLTVVATEAFRQVLAERFLSIDDDEALGAVIGKCHARLFRDRSVMNPVDRTEDLNRIDSDAWAGFLPRLDALHDIAERALARKDEASSALVWSEAFSFLMPLPETESVEIVDSSSGQAVMQIPDIDISVYSRNPRKFEVRHRNEVAGVAKDCDLEFSIVNRHLVPDHATVEWTVRNEGTEADARSDLGHRRLATGLFEAKEHTAYAGRHFMDCVIRLAGQVYAVRRVPVVVRDVRRSAVAVRPAYTKIRSMRGRK